MVEPESREAPRADRRSRRTRHMLADALMALMLEKRYDAITVQEIIDRANVGRSTFYAHYLDKDDLRQSAIADLVALFGRHMEHSAGGRRIIPSLELLRHVRESQVVYRALVRGLALEAALQPMQTQLTQYVEARLARRLPPGATPTVPLPVIAQYVVGALLTLFQWWIAREMPESPEQIDNYFLQLVRPSVYAATGIEI